MAFSKDKQHSRWYISWHNSSLLQGLGNKMKLKSRLQPFSLICIQCQFMFCYQFCNPPPSNKCCYMPTVWLDILGHSKSIFWDYVFSQLTKKYQWSAWQCTWVMFQSNTESSSSSRYGFITIQLQINHYCSLKKYANQIFTFTVLKLLVYTKSDSIAKLVNIIFTLFSMTVITFSSMWCIFLYLMDCCLCELTAYIPTRCPEVQEYNNSWLASCSQSTWLTVSSNSW